MIINISLRSPCADQRRINHPDYLVTKNNKNSGKITKLLGTKGNQIHNDKVMQKSSRSSPSMVMGSKSRRATKIIRADVARSTQVHSTRFEISGNRDLVRIRTSSVLTPIFTGSGLQLSVDAVVPLHPLCVNSFRLRQLASLFSAYRFTNFRVKWCPRVPTTTAGSVGIFYVDDPSVAFNSKSSVASAANLEAQIVESECGDITPVFEPMILSVMNLHHETNNWYKVSQSSGNIVDTIQGAIIVCEGVGTSTIAVNTEIGFMELDFEIEFAHPVSPLTVANNGTLGGGTGIVLQWSLLSYTANAQFRGNGTNAGLVAFWQRNQGVFVATNSQYDWTVPNTILGASIPAFTGLAQYPPKMGQTYIVSVKVIATTVFFDFFSSYGAYLQQDYLSTTTTGSASIPVNDWQGFEFYCIASGEPTNSVAAVTLPDSVEPSRGLQTPAVQNGTALLNNVPVDPRYLENISYRQDPYRY